MDEFVLVESSRLRQELCTEANTDVLERIGTLMTLPGSAYATTQNVADFYLVGVATIRKICQRHEEELHGDGYKVLSVKEFREGQGVPLKSKSRKLAMFPKRAVLRVGMLLKDSMVAKEVRTTLLNERENFPGHKALTSMAHQLAEQALESSRHAQQIKENSEQLVAQSKMVIAIVNEISQNRDRIHSLEKRMAVCENRMVAFEESPRPLEVEFITAEEIEVLREKVQAKAKAQGRKAVSIWKKLNKRFGVTRYRYLPQEKFAEALEWLECYNF